MANTITVTYKVNEDGSLSKIAKQADNAAKATDGASKAADRYSKRNKGVAGATSNSTKSFSKMTTGITGGLVPAYATLAANVFALSAAFNFFKRAADVKLLEDSQIRYAQSTGIALQSITQGLRQASGGMLGFREAAEAAAIGVAKGFSPKQMEDLAAGAKRASQALGRDFGDSFDRLVRGASKAEPELLDELGITLKLADATARYAKTLGVQEKALTASQRSQAVLVETQRQLDQLFGTGISDTNPFVELSKTFEDLVRVATNSFLPILSGIAGIINRSLPAAVAVFGMLAVSIAKMALPMDGIKLKMTEWANKSRSATEAAIADQIAYQKELEDTKAAIEAQKLSIGQKSANTALEAGPNTGKSKLLQKVSAGQTLSPMQSGQLKKMLRDAEIQYKIHGNIIKGTFKGVDIAIVEDVRKSFNNMTKSSRSFSEFVQTSFTKIRLKSKTVFAKVKEKGVGAFRAIGRAAKASGQMIDKAMRMAGIIGIIMMVGNMLIRLAEQPYTIMKGFLDGLSTVLNKIGTALGPGIMVPIGEVIDWVWNKWKWVANILIKGINKIAGAFKKEPLLEEWETGTTGFADAMTNASSGTLDLADGLEKTPIGSWALSVENAATAMNTQNSALKNMKTGYEKLGKDLAGVIVGMEKQTDAEKGLSQATFISTMGLGDKLNAIRSMTTIMGADGKTTRVATLNEEQRAEALKDLRYEMRELGSVSKEAAELLADGSDKAIGKLIALEARSRDAITGLKAYKDAVNGVTSAMASGDLRMVETLLKSMKAEAEAAFTSLKGIDTPEAVALLIQEQAKYNSVLGLTTMTTDEYLKTVTDLRLAQEAHKISLEQSYLITGKLGELRDKQLAVAGFELAIKELETKKLDKKNEALLDQYNLEIKLLNVRKEQAELAIIAQKQGQGMADASAVGTIASSAKSEGKFNEDAKLSTKIGAFQDIANPMLETLKSLGPDGEAMSAAMSGAFALAETFASAFEKIKDKGLTVSDGLGMAASAVQALGSMQAAQSKAAIAGVDREIDAEKKRDGKSSESIAKLKALEAKKESMKRKAFEQDKKMKMAQTAISTVQAVMNAYASAPFPYNIALAAMVGAIGAAQLSSISSMTYDGGGASGAGQTNSITVGSRANTVDLATSKSASGELAYMRGESGIGSSASNFKPAFTGAKYRAAGGMAGYMVGEQGPELFMPDRPGRVVPAGEVGNAGSAPVNVSFSIQTIDSQDMEQALIRQRGNIIGMIREAANNHGEFFLESINTQSYETGGGGRQYDGTSGLKSK